MTSIRTRINQRAKSLSKVRTQAGIIGLRRAELELAREALEAAEREHMALLNMHVSLCEKFAREDAFSQGHAAGMRQAQQQAKKK